MDLDEFEAEGAALVFDVGLDEQGDDGSGYRTENDPADPFQRANITERRGLLDVRCVGRDVVHGYLKDGQGPASLLVYEFLFDTRRLARRITRAHIEFVYHRSSADPTDPEVVRIAPKGRMIVAPTVAEETRTREFGWKAGAAAAGAEAGISWRWETATTQQTRDATTVVGSIDLIGRTYGASNGASWTLMENQSVKTGVPPIFRTAVLLKRVGQATFDSTFRIKVSADVLSELRYLFGSRGKDSPVLYDPAIPPTNTLQTYDTNNLGSVDLEDLSCVAFSNYES